MDTKYYAESIVCNKFLGRYLIDESFFEYTKVYQDK